MFVKAYILTMVLCVVIECVYSRCDEPERRPAHRASRFASTGSLNTEVRNVTSSNHLKARCRKRSGGERDVATFI
jgi:hypothetical protein